MTDAGEALLDRCLAYLREVGFSQLSLREIASGVGTSHRMLIYHFGSREGLLAAIVGRVEAEQRAALIDLTAGADPSAGADPFAGADVSARGTELSAGGVDVSAGGADVAGGRADLAEVGRRFWRQVSDPALAPAERLFFEIYAHALYGRDWTASFRTSVITAWVDPIVEALIASGLAPDDARRRARLGLAATRGLLLDLLITGDRAILDDAADLFNHLLLTPSE